MDRVKKAHDTMAGKKGNCAQSVFTAFSGDLGLDEKIAFDIAQGFGGGMSVNGVCGAVTGAYMVLGLANPVSQENPQQSADKIRTLRNEFNRKFKELHGGLTCTELLGYNLTIPEEATKAREIGVFTTICPNLVRDSAKIIESLIK